MVIKLFKMLKSDKLRKALNISDEQYDKGFNTINDNSNDIDYKKRDFENDVDRLFNKKYNDILSLYNKLNNND